MTVDTALVVAAIAAMYGVIATGFLYTYRGRIADLRDQIKYLRGELDECHDEYHGPHD